MHGSTKLKSRYVTWKNVHGSSFPILFNFLFTSFVFASSSVIYISDVPLRWWLRSTCFQNRLFSTRTRFINATNWLANRLNGISGIIVLRDWFFSRRWLADRTLYDRCSLLLWRQWESWIVIDATVDRTPCMDAWKKCHAHVHVHVFLKTNAWMFQICRRHYN